MKPIITPYLSFGLCAPDIQTMLGMRIHLGVMGPALTPSESLQQSVTWNISIYIIHSPNFPIDGWRSSLKVSFQVTSSKYYLDV